MGTSQKLGLPQVGPDMETVSDSATFHLSCSYAFVTKSGWQPLPVAAQGVSNCCDCCKFPVAAMVSQSRLFIKCAAPITFFYCDS